LSDGVFAIALTVLVLSLKVDTGVKPADLAHALRTSLGELGAYALSVVVIGAFWMGHHRLFAWIERVDIVLMWLNLAFLGLVALIPFPTDVLGRYGRTTEAVVLYAAVIGTAALVSFAMSYYARWQDLAPSSPGIGWNRSLPVAFAFYASIPVAVWSPRAAIYLWLAVVPLRVLSARYVRRHA
jgi:uncharacterized membrane protein